MIARYRCGCIIDDQTSPYDLGCVAHAEVLARCADHAASNTLPKQAAHERYARQVHQDGYL